MIFEKIKNRIKNITKHIAMKDGWYREPVSPNNKAIKALFSWQKNRVPLNSIARKDFIIPIENDEWLKGKPKLSKNNVFVKSITPKTVYDIEIEED